MTEEQIRYWIASGQEHKVYDSYEWKQAAAKARELQHDECQRCKAEGWYRPCDTVHHKQYLKVRPDLVFEQSNLECLCREHHEEEHGRIGHQKADRGYTNQERW